MISLKKEYLVKKYKINLVSSFGRLKYIFFVALMLEQKIIKIDKIDNSKH
jgi:hypothetical protein